MYDGIFDDVEHVKKVLESCGHPCVDGTLVFELLEQLEDRDKVVKILLGRQIKLKTNTEDSSCYFGNIGDSSNSSDDLEVIHDNVSLKPAVSENVDLTIDNKQETVISEPQNQSGVDNKTEKVLCTSSSNSTEPLIDLTTEIPSNMEVDKSCSSDVWPQIIEVKADDVDFNDSVSGSESEMEDYYRRPPSIESHDSEGFVESDNKVFLPQSPILSMSPNFENQHNNETSNLEIFEENNNDPNNNLEDIEVQNNPAFTTTENQNLGPEIIEVRCPSPKPGCSKDSYYADVDSSTPDVKTTESETRPGKNQTPSVGNTSNMVNIPDSGDNVAKDDDTPINEEVEIERDVSMIQKILPHFTKSRIWSLIAENREAINRVEIAFWELLPEEKPLPIFHPKRKQINDNCPLPVKKFVQDDNTRAIPAEKPLTVVEGKSAGDIIKPAKFIILDKKTDIVKPSKLVMKQSDSVIYPAMPSPKSASNCVLKPSRLEHLRSDVKTNNNEWRDSAKLIPSRVEKNEKKTNEKLSPSRTSRTEVVPPLPRFDDTFKESSHTEVSASGTSQKSDTNVASLVQVFAVKEKPETSTSIQQKTQISKHPCSTTTTETSRVDSKVPVVTPNSTVQKPPAISKLLPVVSAKMNIATANSNASKSGTIPKIPINVPPAKVANKSNNTKDSVAAGPSQNKPKVIAVSVDNMAAGHSEKFKYEVYQTNLSNTPDHARRELDARLQAYADSLNMKSINGIEKHENKKIRELNAQILRNVNDLKLQTAALIEDLRPVNAKKIEKIPQPKPKTVPIAALNPELERHEPARIEKPELPPNELYNPLLNMFPDVDPNYIAELCISAKPRNQGLESLVEILLINGFSHPRIYNPEPEPQDINPDAQYENLQGIFPDAEREYLRDIAERYYNDPDGMKAIVQAKLENPDYPKMADYLKRIKITEQIKQYTDDFSVENFLQIFPDPFKHFENPKRINRYNVVAFEFLKSHFKQNKVATIVRAYRGPNHPNHLSLAAKMLETTGPDMKSRRLDKQIPTEDIPLLQEMAFIRHKAAIKEVMSARAKQEKREFKRLKANHELLECQCCFDTECMPSKCLTCSESHIFCVSCIKAGAAAKIGEGQTHIPCFADCQSEFALPVLQKVLEPTMFSILLRKRQEEEVKAAGLEGLVSCPFCHFASIPPAGDKVFKCLNPECMKESCRLCKELNHVPLRCDEVIKGEEARHYLEEKMTEALVRKCYKCSRPFFKEEGCNKMTCPCGASTCYICGVPVTDYRHFNGQGSTRTDLCPLWSDNNVLNAQTVRVVAEAAEKEILKKNPNIKLDTKSLIPAIPRPTKGPHQDIANGHVLPVQARRV